jgi:hypothetical protein
MSEANIIDPGVEQPQTPGLEGAAEAVGAALEEHLQEIDDAYASLPKDDGFLLPSGVRVVMRPGKGRDLLAAQRAAATDTNLVVYGLIAALCTFGGEKRVLEDILDMPLGDVLLLNVKIGELTGGDFLPSTPLPSSISQP